MDLGHPAFLLRLCRQIEKSMRAAGPRFNID
jgi:hypothetical protein